MGVICADVELDVLTEPALRDTHEMEWLRCFSCAGVLRSVSSSSLLLSSERRSEGVEIENLRRANRRWRLPLPKYFDPGILICVFPSQEDGWRKEEGRTTACAIINGGGSGCGCTQLIRGNKAATWSPVRIVSDRNGEGKRDPTAPGGV